MYFKHKLKSVRLLLLRLPPVVVSFLSLLLLSPFISSSFSLFFTNTTMANAVLFEDIFEVKHINPDGKKFDRGLLHKLVTCNIMFIYHLCSKSIFRIIAFSKLT